VIAFLGSVFSPYYAWRRRRDAAADPLAHCAVNVALYGPARRWAMTERGRGAVDRGENHLTIGPSDLTWDGDALTIRIAERSAPLGRRLRGSIRVTPKAWTAASFALDAAAQHHWCPMAPSARVELALDAPALRWSGPGYLDSNSGTAPLETGFRRWTWSRAGLADGTAILYDVTPRDGAATSLALHIDRAGGIRHFASPPVIALPRTGWRLARETRAEDGRADVRQTLEDTPFYARSVLRSRLLGQDVTAMHESLSLERFQKGIVQAMLPFRMPRHSG
jgi:carotenoid 1,2-hydratase